VTTQLEKNASQAIELISEYVSIEQDEDSVVVDNLEFDPVAHATGLLVDDGWRVHVLGDADHDKKVCAFINAGFMESAANLLTSILYPDDESFVVVPHTMRLAVDTDGGHGVVYRQVEKQDDPEQVTAT
jgi:hypothetical protein